MWKWYKLSRAKYNNRIYLMTTIREYFDTDTKALNAQSEWILNNKNSSSPVKIIGKISYIIDTNVKYWSFYFPQNSPLNYVKKILSLEEVMQCCFDGEPSQTIGFVDSPERYNFDDFHFTKQIYIYIDETLTKEQIDEIKTHGKLFGFNIVLRDKNYVKEKAELSIPLAFISHDSRDKNILVEELVRELNSLACPVWYDKYALKGGDNLRESIEKGLKESKKCILILSPNFLENTKWAKSEFETIFIREIYKKEDVIIPVWHNVSENDIYEYSPKLLSKVGLNTSVGIKDLAKKIVEAINN